MKGKTLKDDFDGKSGSNFTRVITHVIHVNLKNKLVEGPCARLFGKEVKKCTICKEVTGSHFIVEKHQFLLPSSNPYMCGICGETFDQGFLLKIHVEIEHGYVGKDSQRSVNLRRKRSLRSANVEEDVEKSVDQCQEGEYSDRQKGSKQAKTGHTQCSDDNVLPEMIHEDTCNGEKVNEMVDQFRDAVEESLEYQNEKAEKGTVNVNTANKDVEGKEKKSDVGEGQRLIHGEGGDLIVINVITEGDNFVENKRTSTKEKKQIPVRQKTVQCNFCSEMFVSVQSMSKHCKKQHPELYFTCVLCETTFKTRKELKTHEKIHFSKFKTTDITKREKKTEPPVCGVCNTTFKTASGLQIHTQNLHPDTLTRSKTLCCEKCGNMFWTRSALSEHYKIHSDVKPFRCECCLKDFRRKSDLTSHALVHTGVKPFVCPHCQKAFRQRAQLLSHLRTHTGEKPYQCEFCPKAFAKRDQYNRHRRVHTNEKPYKCKECGRSFKSTVNLKAHVRVHTGEKPFVCRHCSRGFAQFANLVHHERSHTGEKPYKCKVCGKGFGRSNNLGVHMKVHSKKPKKTKDISEESKVKLPKTSQKDKKFSKLSDISQKLDMRQNAIFVDPQLSKLPSSVFLPVGTNNHVTVSTSGNQQNTGILTMGTFTGNVINPDQICGGNFNSHLLQTGTNPGTDSRQLTSGLESGGMFTGTMQLPSQNTNDNDQNMRMVGTISAPSANEIIATAFQASLMSNPESISLNGNNFTLTPVSCSDSNTLFLQGSLGTNSLLPPDTRTTTGLPSVSETSTMLSTGDTQTNMIQHNLQGNSLMSHLMPSSLMSSNLPTQVQFNSSSDATCESIAVVLSSLSNYQPQPPNTLQMFNN